MTAAELRVRRTERVLRRTIDAFAGRRFALVSAFGPGSGVLLDMLHRIARRVPVVFIDTLHHFPETLEHVERVRARYDLDLHVYRPAESRLHFELMHGERLWQRDIELYQWLTKVEPFQRATQPLDGWITGRRRDQSPARARLRVIETGAKVRVNPLAWWSRGDVWSYIETRALPYNPLHDRGYTSIGDEPLTSRVADGEPERAGRWRGTGRLECGIHTVAVEAS